MSDQDWTNRQHIFARVLARLAERKAERDGSVTRGHVRELKMVPMLTPEFASHPEVAPLLKVIGVVLGPPPIAIPEQSRAEPFDDGFKGPAPEREFLSGLYREEAERWWRAVELDAARRDAVKLFQAERARAGGMAKSAKYNHPKEEIRRIWAEGNFTEKKICAEEEHALLGITMRTAINYLNGAPDPNPSRRSRAGSGP